MRSKIFSNRRRAARTVSGAGVTRLAKAARGTPTAPGGPVAPTAEYVGRRGRRKGGTGRAGASIFPRRRRSALLVRRAVLAVLLCASIGLITATYRGGVVIHGFQLAALEVVAPIERGLSRAWDPVAGAWNWTGRLFSAAGANTDLRRDNDHLRQQLAVAQDQQAELERLRRQIGMSDRRTFALDYRMVTGRVISRVAGPVDRSVMIDLGTDDGIEKNDPVMVTAGLIGRVLEVGSNTARVGLMLDTEQAVSAAISGRDAWGVLQSVSNESSPVMQIKFVPMRAKVEQGDLVVTAGWTSHQLRSLYPRGIPIGEVSSVGNSPGDLYRTVQVTPFANFDRIDEVIVLVPRGDRESFDMAPLVTRQTARLTGERRVDPAARAPARARRAAAARRREAGGGT